MACQGQRCLRLGRRTKPQKRQRQPGLDDLPRRRHATHEVGEENGVELLVLGQGRYADSDFGQDTQSPFGAKHKLAQVGAGGRCRERRQAHLARRGQERPPCE